MRVIRLIICIATLYAASCTRRPLSDTECSAQDGESADINVSVDWSVSGFDLEQQSKGDDDYIHRVSFRFFPQDGSAAFDRYLEDDVENGTINVPIGVYSVVIFNEAVNDVYWEGAITFDNVDSYDNFSASIADQSADLYFYSPAEGENLSTAALQLASASVANFEVSTAMCKLSREGWSDDDLAMEQLLNGLTPRRLTCSTTIAVEVENLASAYTVHTSLSGLAQRVFMASGDSDSATTTHVWELTEREWSDEEQQHGTISESRLTFSTPSQSSTHTVTLDIYLINGSHHSPEEEMVYEVTDQIVGAATRYADNDLSASVSLSLPEVSGDIEVNDWEDDETITIQ